MNISIFYNRYTRLISILFIVLSSRESLKFQECFGLCITNITDKFIQFTLSKHNV